MLNKSYISRPRGPFDPTTAFAGGVAGYLYDLRKSATITSSGGVITSISDFSGNGHTLGSSVSGTRPALSTASGRQGALFDGVNDWMFNTCPMTGSSLITSPITDVIVLRMPTGTFASGVPLTGSDNTAKGLLHRSGTESSPNIFLYSGASGPTLTVSMNTILVLTCIWKGSLSRMRLNGGAWATGDASTSIPQAFQVGTYNGSLYAAVEFYGMIRVAGDLNSSNPTLLSNLETWFTPNS